MSEFYEAIHNGSIHSICSLFALSFKWFIEILEDRSLAETLLFFHRTFPALSRNVCHTDCLCTVDLIIDIIGFFFPSTAAAASAAGFIVAQITVASASVLVVLARIVTSIAATVIGAAVFTASAIVVAVFTASAVTFTTAVS